MTNTFGWGMGLGAAFLSLLGVITPAVNIQVAGDKLAKVLPASNGDRDEIENALVIID